MKYIIPDLEKDSFPCFKFCKSTTIKSCYKCCYINECFNINIQIIENNVISYCERNNEEKFCIKNKCNKCKGTYINIPGGFQCENCGNIISISKTELKKILKKDYEEIDYNELNEKIDYIKTRYEILTQIKTNNKEENKIIKNAIDDQKQKDIIDFKNIKRKNQ